MMKEAIYRADSIKNISPALKIYTAVIYTGNGGTQEIIDIEEVTQAKSENKIHGKIRDLKNPNTTNLSVGASSEPHPSHTDACYTHETPSHIMLQSVIEDQFGGGLGLYWGLKNLYDFIPDKFYHFLKEFPVIYSRNRDDGTTVDSYTGTIINKLHYDEMPKLRWRYDSQVRPLPSFELSKAEQKEFDDAITWVINYFNTEIPIVVPYRRNDIIIASNQYITHGRTRILDPNRHSRRIWLDIKEH